MSDWVKDVIGPLGELHADSAKIINLIQDAADKDIEPEIDLIKDILYKMVLDVLECGKVVDPNHGGGANLKYWSEGITEVLSTMREKTVCQPGTIKKMEDILIHINSFR